VATAVTHLCLVRRALGPDEGGFLVVARHWHDLGPYLYGPTWVDRPPGLIALFALAGHLGPWGVRLTMVALSVTLVALAATAARLVGGKSAAPWAAWTAYAIGSSTLLQAEQLNGEYAAATFVCASMVLVLFALKQRSDQSTGRWMLTAVGAGVAAAAAVTMKQNFFDAFVFAAVLLGGTALVDRTARRFLAAIAAGFATGAAIVVAVTLAWSRARGGPAALMFAMYGFRARATEVMQQGPWTAPDQRMWELLALCIGSGLLVLAVHLAWQHRTSLRSRNPLAWALAATAGFELVSLVAGANFWPHYALAFIPVLAVSAGLAARRGHPGWLGTQRIVAAMAVITAVFSPVMALANGPGEAWAIGRWVHQSAAPRDTIVVTYTHPNVVAASGLRPAYPYLWSLPARTLDPHLATLTEELDDPHGPTWVVIWDHPQSWKLDRSGQLQRSLHQHYRLVNHVCRHPVWLRSDITRPLAPLPTNCGGGAL
jgi:4-amino-4-deoxy-L-arabinose transferase-like glycosyltransferase